MRNLHCWVSIFLTLIIIVSHNLVWCYSEQYSTCGRLFSCGNLTGIGYPFWGGDRPKYCGRPEFELVCESNGNTSITIKSIEYSVKHIDFTNQTLKIARKDYLQDLCPNISNYVNTTLDHNTFDYGPNELNITMLYNCTKPINGVQQIGCSEKLAYTSLTKDMPINHNCNYTVVVPVLQWVFDSLPVLTGDNFFWEALQGGFDIVWKSEFEEMCNICEMDDGHCGYDLVAVGFICLCGDGSYNQRQTCSKSKGMDLKTKLIIAFSVCGGTALMMLAIFFIYQRHKKANYAPSSYFTRNVSSDLSSINDPEKMGAFYGVKFFTYDELEEATDSFNDKREIGDGGFGTVYLGKLKDGRTVAVKRLYENNFKRVEQFLNEVEILTRLRHKNLVMLYGCTSRHSRELLLVYEYISNGTVADHVHGRNAKPGSLLWETRLKIAVETASALKYLHASDIIHRDVKTNNILLDDNFSVKVADFGLSRLFPLDVTHVSTAPQGTPGYVDPEYHQCYQLTDKSDVYSFGVVLVELISSKPAVDITRHRHEINLSNMAINRIQNGSLQELVDPSLGFDRDCNVHKSVTAVAELAFQCLQSDKDMRPTMQEVLEILTRIQCGDSHIEDKAEELDVFSEEFVLLKSGPLPPSPDSVTVKWVSGSVASSSSS